MKIPKKRLQKDALRKSQSGIALFMVMSTLALLTTLVTELTYTTQVNARLAYNSVDNVKAYYLAKAAFKLSMLRLRAFKQVGDFLNDKKNSQMKGMVPKDVLDKIWSFPFVFPIPVPPEATAVEGDSIKKFLKESTFTGTFTANISSESNRFNLNNLMIKEVPEEKEKDKSTTDGTTQSGTQAKSGEPPKKVSVDFRPMAENVIHNALESKKTESREFSDTYRNVQAQDIMDAILAYMTKEVQNSNLPGFKRLTAKDAPLYSMTELHLIPGLDDTLYNLIEPLFTVNTTPGINVNTAQKTTIQSLIPEASDEDVEAILRKRDDPDVGKPWENEEEFWKAVQDTTGRSPESLKERLKKANVKIITTEQSFKISIIASQGQSQKRIEAYVITDPETSTTENKATDTQGSDSGQQSTQGQPASGQNTQQNQDNKASEKKKTGLNLVYWRMI